MRFGFETVTYIGPQILNLIADNIKNLSSLENFERKNNI